mmetsp:Transcript_3821/g.11499  ORF Transcript_3821/g.11499 Transcript_3821/m.11499 type:complete len:220 (-) Transcript_3821:3283-3942(-)
MLDVVGRRLVAHRNVHERRVDHGVGEVRLQIGARQVRVDRRQFQKRALGPQRQVHEERLALVDAHVRHDRGARGDKVRDGLLRARGRFRIVQRARRHVRQRSERVRHDVIPRRQRREVREPPRGLPAVREERRRERPRQRPERVAVLDDRRGLPKEIAVALVGVRPEGRRRHDRLEERAVRRVVVDRRVVRRVVRFLGRRQEPRRRQFAGRARADRIQA